MASRQRVILFLLCDSKVNVCGRGPSSELTPAASAASLGHERLQVVVRDSRFARYCEEYALADAF